MANIKLWVDDIRPAPSGYIWCAKTLDAIKYIQYTLSSKNGRKIEVLDLDHDAGDYAKFGGDYIKILDWMEEHGVGNIPVRIHSQNAVGVENMRRIIEHNGWEEI